MTPIQLLYKVLRASEAAALIANGRFAGSADDIRDGFIHLSTIDQVEGTLKRHFYGKPMLFLGLCRAASLADALRMEPSRDGVLFPHLYRPLVTADVAAILPIPEERDGWRVPSFSPLG